MGSILKPTNRGKALVIIMAPEANMIVASMK